MNGLSKLKHGNILALQSLNLKFMY